MLKKYVTAGKARPAVSLVKKLAAVAALCILVRAAADRADGLVLPDVDLPEAAAKLFVSMELPGCGTLSTDAAAAALMLELPGCGFLLENGSTDEAQQASDADTTSDTSVDDTEEKTGDDGTAGSAENTESTETDAAGSDNSSDAVSTTITGDSGGYVKGSEGIYLKNKTDYEIDVDALLNETLEFSAADGAQVLIIHTHGSEAYMPDGEDTYEPSDPSRTENKNYNVVRVGDELERVLTERGITVIHDRELYDYPSYTGSYSRAYDAICGYLDKNPDIKVVIDLHRDALVADDGTVYKTVADIGDTPCAQVMLIAGTNFSGLNHPNWQKNLSFALKIQAEMVSSYPTLARPLSISQYRYNQNATTGSLIAEVGCNGNTLQEAITAAGYFGECLADVLLEQ